MRNLFILITGFAVSGAGVLALALALPHWTNSPTKPATQKAMPMSGMASMSSGAMDSASPASVKLTIRHVQRGCHVWARGSMTGPMMLLQFAGPMRLHMGGPMMMGHGMTIAFMQKGAYRLGTKTVEMKGGGMDIKTIGPDNHLRLLVTVA